MSQFEQPFTRPDRARMPHPSGDVRRIYNDTASIDPEIVRTPASALLVEIGARCIASVTDQHGTPAEPRWHRGTVDHTMMTYHNGESNSSSGHTSVNLRGAGVPRNVLLLSGQINRRAGRSVVGPVQRGLLFGAAGGHDLVQLCGRSIEVSNGDEEQSARHIKKMILDKGYTEAIAEEGSRYVKATIYDPKKGKHVIATSGQTDETILGQEIMAGSDLLSPATVRGPLGSMEWTLEEMGLRSKDRILHTELAARGKTLRHVNTLGKLLMFVDDSEILRGRFVGGIRGQAGWIEGLHYQDDMIKRACGVGIDTMFPGRSRTADKLRAIADEGDKGAPMRKLWQLAGGVVK